MKAGKQEIPRRPMLWLTTGLLFTVPPMIGTLSAWVWVAFATALLAKFWMERRGWRLRSVPAKLALSGCILGGVKLTYGSLGGLEPLLSLFLLYVSLKVLEAHTARDFHIQALVGWLLCLSGLFISQNLLPGIYAMTGFVVILSAVVQFHRGTSSRRPVSGPLFTSGALVLRALPVVAVLFFFFPRISAFQFHLSRRTGARSGMSNDLKPGSISSLALSNEVAFRAEFPDGNMPSISNLYWRGAVLTQDDGLSWRASTLEELPQAPEHLGALQPVRQRIFLQPHGGLWIFALEWPASIPPHTMSLWGDVLRSDKEIFGQWRYEVTSYRANRQGQLDPDEKQHCLIQLPTDITTRDRELAASWTAGLHDQREIVARGLAYFHEQKFIYTLNPGKYEGKEALDEFLFRRRSGFCEHYAAAFGTLMRLAGVPSRVVLGYHGGQFNHLGKYIIVHQSDAHAWCEVWIDGRGWERADPTASVGGGDIADFVDMRNAATASTQDSAGLGSGVWDRQPFLRNIRLAWDAITYAWDSRIADFDDENQRAFFLNLHWPDARPLRLMVWLVTALGCLLGVQSLWTWWRTRVRRDPLKMDYERFCKRLAAHGVTRQPWEGPATFAERAAVQLPALAAQIRYAANLYVMLRYSHDPGERDQVTKEFRKMARV